MAFMETSGGDGGQFVPYVKYNAKAGRWYTKKDEPDAVEFEVPDMTAVFDMDNLQTGWFLFAAGTAPVKHMDPSLEQAAPSPGEGFKRGFQIEAYSEKNLLGRREFASTAGAVIDAMNELHDAWLAGREANAGKLPVVKCTGVTAITGSYGTNYKPSLEIVSWTDRPADMPGASAPAASTPTPAAASPAPAAQAHTPPPAAAAPPPAPQPAGADVEF